MNASKQGTRSSSSRSRTASRSTTWPEEEFDQTFCRLKERGLDHWADPLHSQPGEINHHDGGRGVYWNDPDGHALEIITRPYGSHI